MPALTVFTEVDEQRIQSLIQAGRSRREVATIVGKAYSTVTSLARKRGWAWPRTRGKVWSCEYYVIGKRYTCKYRDECSQHRCHCETKLPGEV